MREELRIKLDEIKDRAEDYELHVNGVYDLGKNQKVVEVGDHSFLADKKIRANIELEMDGSEIYISVSGKDMDGKKMPSTGQSANSSTEALEIAKEIIEENSYS